MGRKEPAADHEHATPAEKSAGQRRGMVIEGEEAVALYARQIARNLTDLEEQVVRLRDACAETKKFLREVE